MSIIFKLKYKNRAKFRKNESPCYEDIVKLGKYINKT